MKIDWLALLRVAGVTFVGALFVIGVVASAATLMASSATRRQHGVSPGLRPVAAAALFGVAGVAVLFGLYLIVPYFR